MVTSSSKRTFKYPQILPIDVLCEIFESYIKDYYHTRPFSLMRRRKDIPWFLGHICRQWRTAAIATPRLWKRLPPFKLIALEDDTLVDFPMFDELLKRSGAHPIRVQFEFAWIWGNPNMESILLMHLIATSGRWEEVTIRCPLETTIASHFRGIEGRIPHLRRVELLLMDEGKWVAQDAPEKLVNIFCNTPMLSELLLQIRPSRFTTLAVPWEQLTKLQWDDGRGIYDVLRYAKNLDTLMVIECEYLGGSDLQDLEHSKLRRFHFHVKEESCLLDLICKLELPALEVLVITHNLNRPYPFWSLIPVLASLLIRSKCDLKHLVLNTGELEEDSDLLDILQVTPNLESLEFSAGFSEFGEILLALLFEGTEEALLPYLHTLILVFPSNITTRQAALIQRVVASRNQVVVEGEDSADLLFSPLQNVCVRIEKPHLRFQVCLDLNGEEVDTTYPIYFNATRFPHLRAFTTRRDFQRGAMALNERQIADIIRYNHAYGLPGYEDKDRSLRKICQSSISKGFIKNLKWMLVGSKDVVYVQPEHELRNSPHCCDIAFGMPNGRLELLRGYCDSEIFAEPREWWQCNTQADTPNHTRRRIRL